MLKDVTVKSTGKCFGGELGLVLPDGKLFTLVGLGMCAGVGAVVYFLFAWCLKLEEARLSVDLAKRLLKRG